LPNLPTSKEQISNRGVYIGVFEQSILTYNAANKSWSFLASVSAELVAVSLMLLIPLIYSDHLPAFQWRSVTVGPQVRPIEPPPVNARSAAGPTQIVFSHEPRIFNPIPPTRDTSAFASGPVTIEPPTGMPIGDWTATTTLQSPIGFDKTVAPRRPERPPEATPPPGPLRVSQGVQMAKLVKQVIPVYPPMARSMRVSGVVHLIGIIAKDGTIRNLQLVSGHPMLSQAALQAVAQWIYKPTLLSGEPVEVICPIDVNFTLSNN
jgi:protein TonB